MLIAAPIIVVMFVLGTASVLAFVAPEQVDLIGPIPQVLSLGFNSFGWVSTLVVYLVLRLRHAGARLRPGRPRPARGPR